MDVMLPQFRRLRHVAEMFEECVVLHLADLFAKSPAEDFRPAHDRDTGEGDRRQFLGVLTVERLAGPDELAFPHASAAEQGVDEEGLIVADEGPEERTGKRGTFPGESSDESIDDIVGELRWTLRVQNHVRDDLRL
ncbi:hypothetical protein [Mycolicibacterium sp. BiH015]|uniref:hypothetical protein n=1 Tax=Mycolicibacterium sp. BiH015 TaxID=3018808 RepID=UPI002FDAF084